MWPFAKGERFRKCRLHVPRECNAFTPMYLFSISNYDCCLKTFLTLPRSVCFCWASRVHALEGRYQAIVWCLLYPSGVIPPPSHTLYVGITGILYCQVLIAYSIREARISGWNFRYRVSWCVNEVRQLQYVQQLPSRCFRGIFNPVYLSRQSNVVGRETRIWKGSFMSLLNVHRRNKDVESIVRTSLEHWNTVTLRKDLSTDVFMVLSTRVWPTAENAILMFRCCLNTQHQGYFAAYPCAFHASASCFNITAAIQVNQGYIKCCESQRASTSSPSTANEFIIPPHHNLFESDLSQLENGICFFFNYLRLHCALRFRRSSCQTRCEPPFYPSNSPKKLGRSWSSGDFKW